MITTRLRDSIPRKIFKEKIRLASSDREKRLLYHKYLDEGRGSCLLKKPSIAEMVGEAIEFYDGKSYSLVEWVVMPNHIHFVYRLPQKPMGDIAGNIKSYTSNQINKLLDTSGTKNWKRDYFDRFARDEQHLVNMSCYTLLNPVKAGLVDDPFDWKWSSIHRYNKAYKKELRKWYRRWKDRFWQSIAHEDETEETERARLPGHDSRSR